MEPSVNKLFPSPGVFGIFVFLSFWICVCVNKCPPSSLRSMVGCKLPRVAPCEAGSLHGPCGTVLQRAGHPLLVYIEAGRPQMKTSLSLLRFLSASHPSTSLRDLHTRSCKLCQMGPSSSYEHIRPHGTACTPIIAPQHPSRSSIPDLMLRLRMSKIRERA